MLNYGILTPHPPAIIPAIGGTDVKKFEKTVNALLSIGQRFKKHQPDTIIVLSPHGESRIDSFTICVPKSETLFYDFSDFEVPKVGREFSRDRILTAQIIEAAAGGGVALEPVEMAKLDYGSAVPLHYLTVGLPEVELVSLGISLGSADTHYRLGQLIRELADESDKKIILVTSMELSHRVTKSSPHGFVPLAAEWDQNLVNLLKTEAVEEIIGLDPFDVDEVGGQQYRGVATLLGAVGDSSFKKEILSYEAPAGVGCCVGYWERIVESG